MTPSTLEGLKRESGGALRVGGDMPDIRTRKGDEATVSGQGRRGLLELAGLTAGALTVGAGILVLIGWMIGESSLTGRRGDYIPVAPNTALLFTLLGGSLLSHQALSPRCWLRSSIAAVTIFCMIVAALTLIDLAAGYPLEIDRWLIQNTEMPGPVPVGRMSAVTAVIFLMTGAAMLSLIRDARTLAAFLSTLIMLLGWVNAVGYAYGIPRLYLHLTIPMALPTAIVFLVLGFGLTAAAGPRAWPLRWLVGPSTRARLLRGLLPTVLLLMLIKDGILAVWVRQSDARVILACTITGLASLVIVGLVVSRASHVIGAAIDRAEASLREREQTLRGVTDSACDAILMMDPQGRISFWNPAAERILGYSLDEALGSNLCDLLASAGGDKEHDRVFRDLLGTGRGSAPGDTLELHTRRKDGAQITVALTLSVVLISGEWHSVGMLRDITTQRYREDELRKLSSVVEQAPSAVVITDPAGSIEYVNPAFCRTTGYTCQEAVGQNPRILKSGMTPAETYRQMWATLISGSEWRGELQNRRKSGELYWELAVIAPLRDAKGATTHYLAVKEDITSRKQMEDELRSAARTDKLTGLANRAMFCDRLQRAVLRSQRLDAYRFAVLFLDFDRFKTINDSLGHQVGDLLLQEIARRLRYVVRAGDSLSGEVQEHTAGRLGGDEFVVLLDGIGRDDDVTLVADRLLDVLAQPFWLGEHEVYSTASIGIVTSDTSADSADDVLRDADTAMYEAKLAGKGRYVLFDTSMHDRVRNRLSLENDLRKALDGGQLFLMYQPIVSIRTGEIEGFEALVRWNHPERGLISPGEFIPIAEDTGLVVPIGEWVLRQACRQFTEWRQTAGEAAPRNLSVNLSRNQLLLPNLSTTIRQILEETQVPPSCLHLEITESAVMRDAELALRLLHEIKNIGVKLDMDDFGTGYSSLACLQQFPIDGLKIDRSFVVNIDRGRDFASLVHAVAHLARNLGIRVVAEGIETVEQLVVLQSLDCELGQGYLFSKPLKAADVAGFSVQTTLLPGAAVDRTRQECSAAV